MKAREKGTHLHGLVLLLRPLLHLRVDLGASGVLVVEDRLQLLLLLLVQVLEEAVEAGGGHRADGEQHEQSAHFGGKKEKEQWVA